MRLLAFALRLCAIALRFRHDCVARMGRAPLGRDPGFGAVAAVLGGVYRLTDARHRLRLDRLAAPPPI